MLIKVVVPDKLEFPIERHHKRTVYYIRAWNEIGDQHNRTWKPRSTKQLSNYSFRPPSAYKHYKPQKITVT